MKDAETKEAYFDAVRRDDIETVARLLEREPTLIHARWKGRGRPDGLMRSLGPPPYHRHSWLPAPVNPADPDDPLTTSGPLHWTQDDDMVKLLVEKGADVNALGSSGELELPDWFLTPLWRAAHDGRLTGVRILVEHGADVNVKNPDGTNQALMTAIENGSAEVARYLLEHGAEPDLHSAAMLGLEEVVARWLEERPSWVDRTDGHGRTPLDAALLMDSFRRRWPQTEAHDRVAERLASKGARTESGTRSEPGRVDFAS